MANTISASVVLYKTSEHQISCVLDSLEQSSERPHVYLVDNSPESMRMPAFAAHWITYVKTEQNKGFGAGHNLAIESIKGKSQYHLILNPDVRFGPEVLSVLKNFMDTHPGVGVVMPRILYPDGSEQRLCKLLPSPVDLIVRRFGREWLQRVFRKGLMRYELRDVDMSCAREVPSLSGCFLLVRTEVLKEVGGFDERYFMYMEDVDLCRRIGEVSDVVFYPGVSIYHEYEKGSYHNPLLRNYHLKSAFKYFNKWGWFLDRRRTRMNREKSRPV
jgi:GT2 family glycosyltransferase